MATIYLGNPEEVVEKVKTHLLAQGCKSMMEDDEDLCAYRGENGRQCAVGCLIPDDVYRPEFEYNDVANLSALNLHFEIEGYPAERTMALLGILQNIHDDYSTEEWERSFDRAIDMAGDEWEDYYADDHDG